MLSILTNRINDNVGLAYDTAKGFIVGEEDTNKNIKRLIENKKISEDMQKICKKRRLEAIKHLATLQMEQPGAAVSVKTRQAARFCLNSLKDSLHEMEEAGILDEHDAEHVDHALQEQIKQIHDVPSWIQPPNFEKQLEHLPWIGQNPKLLQEIVLKSNRMEHKAGDVIYRQNDESNGMYILTSGIMKVYSERHSEILTEEYFYAGRYFGEIGVITGDRRWATVVAETPAITYFLTAESVTEIVKKYDDIYYQFVLSFCISKTSELLQDYPTFTGWSDVKLKTHLANGELIDLREVSSYKKRIEGEFLVLIRGFAESRQNHRKYTAANGDCLMLPNHESHLQQYGDEQGWLFSIPPVNFKFQQVVSDDKTRVMGRSNTSLQTILQKSRSNTGTPGASTHSATAVSGGAVPTGLDMFAFLTKSALYAQYVSQGGDANSKSGDNKNKRKLSQQLSNGKTEDKENVTEIFGRKEGSDFKFGESNENTPRSISSKSKVYPLNLHYLSHAIREVNRRKVTNTVDKTPVAGQFDSPLTLPYADSQKDSHKTSNVYKINQSANGIVRHVETPNIPSPNQMTANGRHTVTLRNDSARALTRNINTPENNHAFLPNVIEEDEQFRSNAGDNPI